MGLSGLCLVHCLGGALMLALLSSTGGLLFSHEIHAVGFVIAAPMAIFALWRGVCAHGKWAVAALGAAGLLAMAAALTRPHGNLLELQLNMLGVALLASAHFVNLRSRA